MELLLYIAGGTTPRLSYVGDLALHGPRERRQNSGGEGGSILCGGRSCLVHVNGCVMGWLLLVGAGDCCPDAAHCGAGIDAATIAGCLSL